MTNKTLAKMKRNNKIKNILKFIFLIALSLYNINLLANILIAN